MDRSTRLILICRGAVSGKGVFGARLPLEPGQRTAAGTLAGFAHGAEAVMSAPETSARETTEALAPQGFEIDPGLSDMDCGAWEGETLAAVAATQADALAAWMSDPQAAAPGGASVADMHRRAGLWLDERLRRGGKIVAVTHAAMIRAMALHVLDAPLQSFWKIDVAPLSVSTLTSDGRRWAIRSLGCGQS